MASCAWGSAPPTLMGATAPGLGASHCRGVHPQRGCPPRLHRQGLPVVAEFVGGRPAHLNTPRSVGVGAQWVHCEAWAAHLGAELASIRAGARQTGSSPGVVLAPEPIAADAHGAGRHGQHQACCRRRYSGGRCLASGCRGCGCRGQGGTPRTHGIVVPRRQLVARPLLLCACAGRRRASSSQPHDGLVEGCGDRGGCAYLGVSQTVVCRDLQACGDAQAWWYCMPRSDT